MIDSYALGHPVMLQLGAYQFGVSSAAYQGLRRSDGWQWPEQARVGQAPALQYVGAAAATVSLDGVIFPEWRGGFGQLEKMRQEAAKARPLVLVDGRGHALGMWVIERVEESQTVFAAGGVARRVEFTLQLKRYSASVAGPVPKLPPLPVPPPVVPLTANTVAAKTQALAANTSAQAAAAATAGVTAHQRLKSRLTPVSAALRSAAGGVQRAIETAREVKRATDEAQAVLARVPGTSRALSVARSLAGRADTLGMRAQSAERVLRAASGAISTSETDNVRAVLQALEAVAGTSSVCRTLATEARKIVESANTVREGEK